MADYIYLLQNRLTPAQRNAVDAVREAARAHSMPVFLVGGGARDLTSGTPVRDLDFVVQGDAKALVEELTAKGARVTGTHPVLGSSYLLFPGGVRAELGTTQTIAYPKPNQPEPHPAVILDDLRRRDFTANAMAISLNEGSYGLLLDPLNGVADIENRELRLVSNYGFIEQPALALRVARLTARLGWTLEERTQSRYETAKEEGYFRDLSAYDKGYELEEIFYEEDPLAALEHLVEEGFGEVLHPAWTSTKADSDALERVRNLMGQLEQMGIHIDPAPALFPLLTAKLAAAEVEDLKSLFARPGFVAQIDGLEAKSKELAGQITARGASAPSDTWKILFAAEPEVVLWLAYSSRSGAVQAKFKAFLNEWPQMRQRVPYALMQEMRITPDLRGYDQLLEDLFFALIDGKLDTVEATRAFLEPYSPPAPVVQASPRRRPAKATRSRSRKAAGVAAAAPEGDEGESSDGNDGEGEAPEAQAVTPISGATKAVKAPRVAKSAGVSLPSKAAANAGAASGSEAVLPVKSESSKEKAGTAKAPASTPETDKVASATANRQVIEIPPSNAVRTAPVAEKKSTPNAAATAAVKMPVAKTEGPAAPVSKKKAVEAVKSVKKAAAPAKKQAVKVTPSAVKSVAKTPAKQAAKAAAKRTAAPAASKGVPAKAAKKAVAPKKATKVAAKGRR